MAQKLFAQGTHLQYYVASVWTTVAQVRGDLELPEIKRDVVDVTNHDSTAGYKEKLPTTIDPGVVKGSVIYDPDDATHAEMFSLAESGALTSFKVILVDGAASTFTFTGFVSQMGPVKAPVNNTYECPFEVTITGAITYPAG